MKIAKSINSASVLRPYTNRKMAVVIGDSSLMHYGVKGMRWGVRKADKAVVNVKNHVTMNLQLFAKKATSRKTVKLGTKEFAHVMSELRTNITKEEKTHTVVNKAIGNFVYSFENHFDDTYRVIGKRKIPESVTGILERIKDE